MERMTDREMLTLAFGAISVSTDENLRAVHDFIREHLLGQEQVVDDDTTGHQGEKEL